MSLVVFAQPQKYGKAMSTIPSKYGFKKIARDIAIEPLFQKFEHVYKVIHGSFRLTARLGVSPRPLAKSKRFPTDCYEIRFFFFEILAGHWKYLQVFLPKFMQFWWLNPDGECQDHSLVQNCYMTAMMALVHVGCQESDLIRQRLVTFFRQASIPNQI